MKTSVIQALLAFAMVALAEKPCDTCDESGNVCKSDQTVVCKGQGNGGLITLGNVLPGALGENCAGGDVYCCSHDAVAGVWPHYPFQVDWIFPGKLDKLTNLL